MECKTNSAQVSEILKAFANVSQSNVFNVLIKF